jgi:hypothetical protein
MIGEVNEYALSVIETDSPRSTSICSGFGSGGGGGTFPSNAFLSRPNPLSPISPVSPINPSNTHATNIPGHLALILLILRNIFAMINLLARKGVAARIRFDTLPRFR